MKYNLLVINKETDQETLFNGFGNLNFINKNGQLLPTRIISQMELEL